MKWIVFDVMGVIFEVGDDTNDLLVPYIQERNQAISSERINALYLSASLGQMPSSAFWQQVGLGDKYPGIERDYLNTRLTIDPGFLAAAQALSQQFSLAILSNDVKEWSEYLRHKHGLNDLFKAIVVSGEVGLRKPDPRIYQIVLERTGAPPSHCALVDDMLRNLQPAAQIGMRTVWFARTEAEPPFAANYQVHSFAELAQIAQRIFP